LRSETAQASEDAVRALQLEKLRAGLRQVLESNPFWRARLHDVTGWDDFERLPMTTKTELLDDQAANAPFGTNLTYPMEEYTRLHQTSGSSGDQPLRWLDTHQSWDWWLRIWSDHIYQAAGVTPTDRIFFAFSFGPFIGFWSAFGGAERLGALAISGGAMTTEQRIRNIRDVGATVLLSTPTYALRMAERATELNLDLTSSDIRLTIHAGEPGASIPSTRSAIEAAYLATSFDHTGMTELGPTGHSCTQRDGIHAIETEFIFEVVDAKGRPALEGELVATNLGRWGSPLFRYRTGDQVSLSREPCSCGSTFLKLVGGIRGRVDDMFTVRGVNLYPSQIEDIVRRYKAVREFVIERKIVQRMDEVVLVVEMAEAGAPTERLEADLRQALGVRIGCRAVPVGTLPAAELKSKRIVTVDPAPGPT
jgi:phenylacetate-CoA ligase